MPSESLYQRLLGPHFAKLHPNLRRFHASRNGGVALGRFRVRRQPGWLCRLLATIAGLPADSAATEVRVIVSRVGTGERWVRSFAGVPLLTFQTLRGKLLVEQAGPTHLGLTVEVVNGGMVFTTERAWVFGVAIPLSVAPSVEATVTPTDRGWSVAVGLRFPLIGVLLEYEGEVIPQWT